MVSHCMLRLMMLAKLSRIELICTTQCTELPKDDVLRMMTDDGDYFGDVEEEEEEEDNDLDGDGERANIQLGVDHFDSDTSSIIEELCFADDTCLGGPSNDFENENEILGGAEVPLSADGLLPSTLDGRRVSIVDGVEEELPMPVVMVVKESLLAVRLALLPRIEALYSQLVLELKVL